MYRLLGEGKLGDEGVIDYLSYSTKIYQLTQKYENVSVYFYDREYRKRQASHNFRWGTDIPHLHTMQLTPRAPRNNAPHLIMSGQGSVQDQWRLMAGQSAKCLTQAEVVAM